MANWTVSLDKPVVLEPPNAVAYVTFASDDSRSESERVPYSNENDLLTYLAKECARRSSFDDATAAAQATVGNASINPGLLTLPDISDLQAADAAQADLNQKIAAAMLQKQIADATVIDPTIADAVNAVQASTATLSAKAIK